MDVGKQLKYGQISGGHQSFEHILASGQTIVAASGKFVKRTGNGIDTLTMADDGDNELLGHLECEAIGTTVAEIRKVVNDPTAVFRIPVSAGTYTHLMKGKTCDLAISNNIQGAKLDADGESVLIIMDGDLVNNAWVDVKLNPRKMHAVGVTAV